MMAAGLLAAGATFDIEDLKVSRSASATSGQVSNRASVFHLVPGNWLESSLGQRSPAT